MLHVSCYGASGVQPGFAGAGNVNSALSERGG